tara:strand:- start:2081 stop:2227 length:147 start_codon:yes stop_codon:yes gene_type:complete
MRQSKEFKPKPWLKKPEDEKKVMGYYYVKKKHLAEAQSKVNKLIKKYQ